VVGKSFVFWDTILHSPLKENDFSQEGIDSIFMVVSPARNQHEAGKKHSKRSRSFAFLTWSSTLMVDAGRSSKTSVNFYQTTWGHIKEGINLYSYLYF
jgi:glyoxylate utilization-related uncharacterized protein